MLHFFGAHCDNFAENEMVLIKGLLYGMSGLGADKNFNYLEIREKETDPRNSEWQYRLLASNMSPKEFWRTHEAENDVFVANIEERGSLKSFSLFGNKIEDREPDECHWPRLFDNKKASVALSVCCRSAAYENKSLLGDFGALTTATHDGLYKALAKFDIGRDEWIFFGYNKVLHQLNFVSNHRRNIYFAKINGNITIWGTHWPTLQFAVRAFTVKDIIASTKVTGMEKITLDLILNEWSNTNISSNVREKKI